ncbi:transposase [Acetobacterium carbinolicum]|uniref:transposase n=1 Tax=Acetobacterium carbinolicum TaxID=52690 RepID=UPI0039BF21A4
MPFTNKLNQLDFDNYILKNFGQSLEFMLGSWDKRFSEIILSSINEDRFVVLFNEGQDLDTNIPISSVVGALILKEVFNLTDDEFLRFLISDLRFQYALQLTNLDKQSFNEQTLSQFRKKVYAYSIKTGRNLLFEEMESMVMAMVDFLSIQPDLYRGKSVNVALNCRLMSQLEVIHNCMSDLVKRIYNIDETFASNIFSHYLSNEDYILTINHLKSGNIKISLQQICNEANSFLEQISERRVEDPEFNQLCCMMTEQLERMNDEKTADEINANNSHRQNKLVHITKFSQEIKSIKKDNKSNKVLSSRKIDINAVTAKSNEINNIENRIADNNTARFGQQKKNNLYYQDRIEVINKNSKKKQSGLEYNSNSLKIVKPFQKIKNRNNNKKFFWLIIGIVFLLEAAYGIYLGYGMGVLLNDSFSRTANAFYVVFIKPQRYASIGLVWNPLPSTVQIPFMYLAELWRPIASKGISGTITTAFFAALSAGMILKTFHKFKVPNGYALLVTLLYTLNPFIFFYGANGMSETISYFFIIYSVCSITQWIKFGMSKYMIHLGFALAGLFLTRYEAIPFATAIAICSVLNILFNPDEKQYILKNNKKERYYYIEGTLILTFLPLVYIILLWILFNFVISGNPLYFLNSVYSNVSQSYFASINGSYFEVLIYVLKRALPFLPLFITIMGMRLIQKKIIKYDFISLAILVIIMLAFHYLMLIKGNSYGWLRFFSYSLPICIAWLPYEISEWKSKELKFNKIIIVSCLIISSLLCFNALKDKDLAKEELFARLANESYIIADYINNEIPDEKILMDVFTLSGVMLNVNNIENLVVSSSQNFYESINDPLHNGIQYILIPDPSGAGSLDAINMYYKNLYENGEEWCVEEESFEGFKLFRVIN